MTVSQKYAFNAACCLICTALVWKFDSDMGALRFIVGWTVANLRFFFMDF